MVKPNYLKDSIAQADGYFSPTGEKLKSAKLTQEAIDKWNGTTPAPVVEEAPVAEEAPKPAPKKKAATKKKTTAKKKKKSGPDFTAVKKAAKKIKSIGK